MPNWESQSRDWKWKWKSSNSCSDYCTKYEPSKRPEYQSNILRRLFSASSYFWRASQNMFFGACPGRHVHPVKMNITRKVFRLIKPWKKLQINSIGCSCRPPSSTQPLLQSHTMRSHNQDMPGTASAGQDWEMARDIIGTCLGEIFSLHARRPAALPMKDHKHIGIFWKETSTPAILFGHGFHESYWVKSQPFYRWLWSHRRTYEAPPSSWAHLTDVFSCFFADNWR